tara:strand:+ start:14842 stop:15363 length:522 start_codon:yes stop_codon:yes gene_type:complete
MLNTRNIVFLFVNLSLGLSVIISYIWGLNYFSEPDLLWGDINPDHIPFIFISMILSAFGYMFFSSYFLFVKKLSNLQFNDFRRVIYFYIAILFFSSLWMPLSILYLETDNKFALYSVLLCLYLVGFSSLLLLKFIFNNKLENSIMWKLSVAGGFQFVFHTLIIDAVYWGINFV